LKGSAAVALRLVSVAILLVAGIAKLADPPCGRPLCFVDAAGFAVNVAVPLIELAVAGWLVARPRSAYAPVALVALGMCFAGFYAGMTALAPEKACGCFGAAVRLPGWAELSMIAALLAAGVKLYWDNGR
jgi:hypothetical protein